MRSRVSKLFLIVVGLPYGRTRGEVRVQFGAFDDRRHADAFARRLSRRGVAAEVWLAPALSIDGDRLLVVTRARYPSFAAARSAASAVHRRGLGAFARTVLFSGH